MSESPVLEQILGDTLAGAIDALVQTGPPLLNDLPLFQRLSDLQTDLGSNTLEASAALSLQPNFGEFLQMVSGTQQIMATLRRSGNRGHNAEAVSAIDEILTRLNINLALALRKEQAHRAKLRRMAAHGLLPTQIDAETGLALGHAFKVQREEEAVPPGAYKTCR